MPDLLALAESITKTLAICMRCGNPAKHTQRLVESEDLILRRGVGRDTKRAAAAASNRRPETGSARFCNTGTLIRMARTERAAETRCSPQYVILGIHHSSEPFAAPGELLGYEYDTTTAELYIIPPPEGPNWKLPLTIGAFVLLAAFNVYLFLQVEHLRNDTKTEMAKLNSDLNATVDQMRIESSASVRQAASAFRLCRNSWKNSGSAANKAVGQAKIDAQRKVELLQTQVQTEQAKQQQAIETVKADGRHRHYKTQHRFDRCRKCENRSWQHQDTAGANGGEP